jgi:hypothetical protein
MKYLAVILCILVASIGGYWYGYAVGYLQATIFQMSDDALREIDAIRELQFNPEVDAKDLHEIRINKSLIAYGKYLETAPWALPGFYSADPVIKQSFSFVTLYRKENPRVVNGIEYAPFNRAYKETEEYQLLEQDWKERTENDESYFKRAMEAQ